MLLNDASRSRIFAISHEKHAQQIVNGLFYIVHTINLCNIGFFHGGDYEECRLLGYENPFRTSQETHYVFATEPSRLMLCKI
jgi:hypothetical protein